MVLVTIPAYGSVVEMYSMASIPLDGGFGSGFRGLWAVLGCLGLSRKQKWRSEALRFRYRCLEPSNLPCARIFAYEKLWHTHTLKGWKSDLCTATVLCLLKLFLC